MALILSLNTFLNINQTLINNGHLNFKEEKFQIPDKKKL